MAEPMEEEVYDARRDVRRGVHPKDFLASWLMSRVPNASAVRAFRSDVEATQDDPSDPEVNREWRAFLEYLVDRSTVFLAEGAEEFTLLLGVEFRYIHKYWEWIEAHMKLKFYNGRLHTHEDGTTTVEFRMFQSVGKRTGTL